jgi:PAS domain S-box-containing protein
MTEKYDSSSRAILNASPIGVTVSSRKNNTLLLANPAFLKIIGAENTKELLTYSPQETWVRQQDFKSVRQISINGQTIENQEFERRKLDRSSCWILLNSKHIIFEGQEATISWQIDITERRMAEQEIAENESRLRQIFEGSPIAIGITRQSDAKIQYANEKYASLLGYTHQEVMEHKASKMWANGEDRAEFIRLFKLYGKVSQRDALGLRKDGSTIWVSISWENFVYNGEGCHLFWFYDISEQKKNEQALEAARDEAQAATRAKSEFLASMSHEIRTPLNGVLGIAELMTHTELNDDQKTKVGTILSSGKTLLAIINDVLDMSKIEAGSMELEEKPFSLVELISTVTTPFYDLARDKNLTLLTQNNIDGDYVIDGDSVRLRQILWNLLSNALKFTQQGQIKLSVEQAEEIPKGDQSTVHFIVEDTGAGISDDRLRSIFEAFTQADNSITRKYGGTGLGLSIVKKLVDIMGGEISVISEIGHGSTFTVKLPFKQVTKQANNPLTENSEPDISTFGMDLNVLIAEDNEINAMITIAFLKEANYSVKHVLNGQLALETAKDGWADIILMDIHMPEMNGVEATEKICALGLKPHPSIIGVTAEAFADRHEIFRQSGMIDVLTKPFTSEQLLDILSAHRLTAPTRGK